jgi:hypothetical protein
MTQRVFSPPIHTAHPHPPNRENFYNNYNFIRFCFLATLNKNIGICHVNKKKFINMTNSWVRIPQKKKCLICEVQAHEQPEVAPISEEQPIETEIAAVCEEQPEVAAICEQQPVPGLFFSILIFFVTFFSQGGLTICKFIMLVGSTRGGGKQTMGLTI